MNVLLAPAHYMLDGVSGGSEYSWAYHIVDSLSAHSDLNLFVITGLVKSDRDFAPNVSVACLNGSNSSRALDLTYSYRLRFVARYYLAARRILRRHRIDVIHHVLPFGYGETFNLLPLLGATRNIPFIIGPLQAPHTVHSTEERIYSQGDFRKYRGARDYVQEKVGKGLTTLGAPVLSVLSSGTLRRSDCLVAMNEHARRLFSTAVPEVRSVVIPPGVPAERFEQLPLNRQRGQAVELLYVGWLIRRKGVDLIIRAMARLVDAFPSIRLRIVGDGPQRRSLEELAAQLGVDRHILFEGAISNSRIADCYADADIFVSMSYSESFGQTLVEAMLAGLPVISAINVGSREIIENGTTGFLVEAGDVGALVERLRELIGNAFQRTTIGARSRQVARQRYNWEMIGEQYLDLYRSVLQRREVDDAPR